MTGQIYFEANLYSMPENVVTVVGIAAGVAEHGKHPYWLAANGKVYPSKWGGYSTYRWKK
jgi:hypothetical protein